MTGDTMTPPGITPKQAGFHMPPEWHRHERSWMAWPCRVPLWHGRIEAARGAYATVARAIASVEPITMLANPADIAEAQAVCGPTVTVEAMPLDDSWMRDFGPTFLIDRAGGLAGADWRFNAWGDKYPDYDRDAAVAATLLGRLDLPSFKAPFVLEGGSIHVDGQGTVLTSEQCLLNKNRNPSLDRSDIERNLREWLGTETIIWLGQGLENDGTDGHVDNLACFARPGVVLALTEPDPADANHRVLADNLTRLRQARDARGRRLEVIEIAEPAPRDSAGGRLALSYINFYLANGAVIMPAFGDPRDEPAAATMARVFPDRRIIQLPVLDILLGGGGIHCITQQQPVSGPISGREGI
ncbi:MAG TPA: agmatine deiminase family protein [Stellaceae bacterium]|nr:agmatine deiminase family protein [Stellaceae bacterium]